jgi:DNA polymerase III subunit gamma/tau
MGYQVLARKWRPRSFRELVGQQHVLQALVNALDHDRLHHAYLFTGTRGVGKTTIARILAKCLNCETGVSSEPCGQCSACVEINEGRFVDLIEVDAASRTKVEDTRELLENVQYAPTRGRYKVYLIDEVHMLSSHSFNALLKTLEEPPPHVKFLLATTDPQKLPVTILSRCLQFHLKNMDPEKIVGHLQQVLEQEMVPFEQSALWQLGRAADGSMRDAMSLTDQAIAFGGGKVAEAEVRAMLGTIDQSLVYRVLDALAQSNASEMLAAVAHLAEHAPDYSAALAELLSVLHRVAIAQALPEALDNSHGDRDRILQLAAMLPAEDVQLFYQTALLGRRDLPMSPDARGGFEMVLLRMLAFRPQGVHSVPAHELPAQTPSERSTEVSRPTPPEVTPVTGDAPAKKSEVAAQPAAEERPPWESPQSESGVTEELSSVVPDSARSEEQAELVTDIDGEGDAFAAPEPVASEKVPAVDAVAAEPLLKEQPAPVAGAAKRLSGLPSELAATLGLKTASSLPQPATPKAPAAEVAMPDVNATDMAAGESSPTEPQTVNKITWEQLRPENWIQVYAGLKIGGVLQSTVSNCQLVGVEPGHVQFVLDEQNSTLYDESHRHRLSALLEDYFGLPVQAHIHLGAISGDTPASYLIRIRREQHQRAVASLQNDPVVQALMQQFDATLDEEQVVSVDGIVTLKNEMIER